MKKILIELHQILVERFNEGELRTLCFHLGVDYDNLPGEGKADKARELIAYLERRNRIPELVKAGKQLRPDVAWGARLEVTKEALSDFQKPLAIQWREHKTGIMVAIVGLFCVAVVITFVYSRLRTHTTVPIETSRMVEASPTSRASLPSQTPNPTLTMTPTLTPTPTRTPTITPTFSPTPTLTPTLPAVAGLATTALDWENIIRLDPTWSAWSGCGATVLPSYITPDQDLSKALGQITQAWESEEARTWQMAPTVNRDVQLGLKMDLTSIVEGKEWIKVGNTVSLSVLIQQDGPERVDVMLRCPLRQFYPLAGTIRDFPSATLQYGFDTYRVSMTFPSADFFSLQPGEFETFFLEFECGSPGVYFLNLDIPFTYSGQSGAVTLTSPTELVCPHSLTLWEVLVTLSGEFVNISKVGDYAWNGTNYVKAP